jgi:glutathione peroxidase-family protein
LMKKSEVNGGGMNEVFAWLKTNTTESGSIKWYVLSLMLDGKGNVLTCRNFTKFLVDGQGKVVGRYGPSKTPKELGPEIEKLL